MKRSGSTSKSNAGPEQSGPTAGDAIEQFDVYDSPEDLEFLKELLDKYPEHSEVFTTIWKDSIRARRARPPKAFDTRIDVADAALKVPRAAVTTETVRWLSDIELWAAAFIQNDPERPGAPHLGRIRHLAQNAINAIRSRDALTAAWCAMHAIDALWIAQTMDGFKMISGGVKAKRSADKENRKRRAAAEALHAAWRNRANEIRAANPRLKKLAIAAKIAKEDIGKGCAANTIRLEI